MRNHKFIFCLLLAALAGCASVSAPPRWLDEPSRAGLDGYGGWIDLKLPTKRLAGELIAVETDTVFVADSALRAVAVKDITSAVLVNYDVSTLVPQVIVGLLSTASHGYYLIFTAPMWLLGGTMLASSRTYDPVIEYPDKKLSEFKPWARYPQGMPPGLDRGRVRMKPGAQSAVPKAQSR
jgi:hypothetical protein